MRRDINQKINNNKKKPINVLNINIKELLSKII